MWKILLGRIATKLAGWRIYALIASLAFAAGGYTCHKLHVYWDAVEKNKAIEKVFDAEETAIELEKDREKIYKEKVKEVVEYVKVTEPVNCFDDTGLMLFNKRN